MIQKLINDTVLKREQEKKANDKIIDHWRSSSLGSCMRGRFLNRLLSGTGIKPEFDVRTLRVFEIGNQIEEYVLSLLEQSEEYTVYRQLEMKDPNTNLVGHLDAYLVKKAGVVNDLPDFFIMECKSKQSKAFWYMDKKGEGAQVHHKMQLHSYLYMLSNYGADVVDKQGNIVTKIIPQTNLKEGSVVYVSKDDMAVLEYPIYLNDTELEKMWKFELETLNTCWEKQTAPPENDPDSWQSKYCEYCKAGLCSQLTDEGVKEMFKLRGI